MPNIMRAPLWHSMAESAGLTKPDGSIGETIYGQMTKFAAEVGAVNLGQGAPGTEPPEELITTTTEAMRDGFNQYAPGQGFPRLLEAVAAQRRRDFDQHVAPNEVLYTAGATEGLTAAILALLPRGGSLVAFEPFYDSYPAAIAAAGGTLHTVPILPDGHGGFGPDWEEFDRVIAAVEPAIILVNTPHNPTGFIFSADDLAQIGRAAESVDAWVLSDEVYEQLTLTDQGHVPPAVAIEDSARVVTVSSAGKSWNVTGWKNRLGHRLFRSSAGYPDRQAIPVVHGRRSDADRDGRYAQRRFSVRRRESRFAAVPCGGARPRLSHCAGRRSIDSPGWIFHCRGLLCADRPRCLRAQ